MIKNKSSDYILGIITGVYFMWGLIHLFWWLALSNGGYKGNGAKFFPLTGDILDYDISELLFYTIVPVLIYFAIKLLRSKSTKEEDKP